MWHGATRCIRPLAFLIWVNGLCFSVTSTIIADLEQYKFSVTALSRRWSGGGACWHARRHHMAVGRIGVTADTALRQIAARQR